MLMKRIKTINVEPLFKNYKKTRSWNPGFLHPAEANLGYFLVLFQSLQLPSTRSESPLVPKSRVSFKVRTQLWRDFVISHISIRINCNRISEGFTLLNDSEWKCILGVYAKVVGPLWRFLFRINTTPHHTNINRKSSVFQNIAYRTKRKYCHIVCVWQQTGFGFMTGFIDHFTTRVGNMSNYSAIANLRTLEITRAPAKSLPACFWQWRLISFRSHAIPGWSQSHNWTKLQIFPIDNPLARTT
jgi:hypothetical protein